MRWWPRRTIRNRLTLRQGTLFFLGGLLLLTLSMSALAWATWTDYNARIEMGRVAGIPEELLTGDDPVRALQEATTINDVAYTELLDEVGFDDTARSVEDLINFSLVSLAVLTVMATVFGFWSSGRLLRPVREITEAARSISDSNLSERLDFAGPQDELKDLADTFDGMLNRLEGAFRAQKEFMSNASHELRTPLAIMKTELDVNLSDPELTEPERRASVVAMQEAVTRSDLVVDRLLSLAESEEVLDRAEVDLAAVVTEQVDHFAPIAENREIGLELQLASAPVVGDGTLLGHMVGNLIQNAVVHNRDRGWIRVSTGSNGDRSWVEVGNSGDGITLDEERRLFDRFYRTRNARSRGRPGVGLGLPIVRSTARAHGGDARATALEEGGLEVRVNLPAADADA